MSVNPFFYPNIQVQPQSYYHSNHYLNMYNLQLAERNIFEILLLPHQTNDHITLIQELKKMIMQRNLRIKSHQMIVGRYLTSNLENNICLIQTLECLNSAHKFFNQQIRQTISSLLTHKYSPYFKFYDELLKLINLDERLISQFLQLLNLIVSWFRLQIYNKPSSNVFFYEIYYLINYVHVISTYECNFNVKIESSEMMEDIFMISTVLMDNSELTSQLLASQVLIEILIQSVFYFLNIFYFHLNSKNNQFRNLKISLCDIVCIIKLYGDHSENYIEQKLVRLMFKRIKVMQKSNEADKQQRIVEDMTHFIVNILFVDDWTTEKEQFWIWRFRNFCDILDIETEHQKASINTIRTLFRELSRYRSICN